MLSTKWTIYITGFLLKVRDYCRTEGEKTVGVGGSGRIQCVGVLQTIEQCHIQTHDSCDNMQKTCVSVTQAKSQHGEK